MSAIVSKLSVVPRVVSANNQTTSLVSADGNLYQAGLIANAPHATFEPKIVANADIQDKLIDVKSTDDSLYLLNSEGAVFQYPYNAGGCAPCGACGPTFIEVYTPASCGGDRAVQIATGSSHCVIRTESCKVYGVGNNMQYQLVPQGQCSYSTAVQLLVTDTVTVNNNNCSEFQGALKAVAKTSHSCSSGML